MDAAGSSASATRTLAIPFALGAPTGNRPASQESSGSSPASSHPLDRPHSGPAQQQALP
jgi:hypothetical protein